MDMANLIKLNCIINRVKLTPFILFRNCSLTVKGAKSGNDNFLDDFCNCHVETTRFQKTLLGIGSAVASISNPRRGDMIAVLGETTGISSLEYVKSKMLESEEGKKILTNKPRINSATIDLNRLESLKDGTVGKTYFNFLKKYGYTPDARLAVRFVDDVELAYVIQRYREVHDLFHAVLDMPTNMLGEVTVKWVEAIQTRLPMCVGGALFGAARLAPKLCRCYSTMRKPVVEIDSSLKENIKVIRKHPGVLSLSCAKVPDSIQDAIIAIVKERNLTNVVEEGRKVQNYLTSRKPPFEMGDIRMKKREITAEVKSKFSNATTSSSDESEYLAEVISSKVNTLMQSRLYHWKPLIMNDKMCYYYMVGRTAAEYAVVSRVFNEIILRDKEFAPKNLFDFGSGVGTVTWVSHKLWGNSLREYFTVDASADMNDLARLILQNNDPNNEPFVHHLFQRQFLPSTPRQFDLVVCAYSLMEMDSLRSRVDLISNLWGKTNKYLVIIEQGTNAGFQIIREARDLVLHLTNRNDGQCHVFAPCPHEMNCPRAQEIPLTPCNFPVTYFPLKNFYNTHETQHELFSYVILKKDVRGADERQWPRVVRKILPRHKHAVCRLCVASGRLEEVVFTASKHGKDIYKCVRSSSWGDLIPVSLKNEDSAECNNSIKNEVDGNHIQ